MFDETEGSLTKVILKIQDVTKWNTKEKALKMRAEASLSYFIILVPAGEPQVIY